MARTTQRSFVEEVPALLAQHGMSMRALAEEIGINQSHLSRVLRHRDYQTPSADLARRVAIAFGLPGDYFPEFREALVIARVQTDPKVRDQLYRRFTRTS